MEDSSARPQIIPNNQRNASPETEKAYPQPIIQPSRATAISNEPVIYSPTHTQSLEDQDEATQPRFDQHTEHEQPNEEESADQGGYQAYQQQPEEADYAPYQQRTLLSWDGLGRPFRQHTKEYYINSSLIVMIIEVILFLFSQYVLMLLVISMLFVVVALAIVPPHSVHYRISTEGIAIDEYFYLWQELYDFYFKRVNGEDILHIRTRDENSSDITLLPGDIPRDYLKSLLINYLPYRETVPLTFIEKSGDWLARTFPLDKMPSRSS